MQSWALGLRLAQAVLRCASRLQESAIYCLGLYRGLLHLFGLPVNLNFANKVSRGCTAVDAGAGHQPRGSIELELHHLGQVT